MVRDMARLTRRAFLAAGAGALVVAAGAVAARDPIRDLFHDEPPLEKDPKGDYAPPRRIRDCGNPPNAIVAENCRPGSMGWTLQKVDGRVEGFFTRPSVDRGQELVLKVASEDPQVRVEVYRSGYYGGLGGRLVEVRTIRARPQPTPHRHEPTGLVSASSWAVSARFDTTDWPSGAYLAKLAGSSGSEGQAIAVVREDERASDALVLIPDTTYQAYNYWGDYSLYAGADGSPRAVRVSYDRPFINVRANQADWFMRADMPLVRWLEGEGYDVTYAAASDVHRGPFGRHRAVIWSGHSEYWSDEMRDATERARDAGTNLAFMGANTAYWRVRFEPDPWSGEPDRVMVCYKGCEVSPTTLGQGPVEDPVTPTTMWRDPKGPNRPENALVGVMYVGQDLSRNYPFVVPADMAADDPLWRHTDLGEASGATTIGQELVGWEWDSVVDNGLTPAGLRRLSATPVSGDILTGTGPTITGSATASAASYRARSGALVFSTGSMLFSWGLDELGLRLYAGGRPQGEPDERIRQLVTNVLVSMRCRPGSPAVNLTI
jgi:hypothetical protein